MFILILFSFLLLCTSCHEVGNDTVDDVLPYVELRLPCMPGEVVRKVWTKGCRLAVTNDAERPDVTFADISVKRRGHSTADKPKVPYTIKFADPVPLLGMKAQKRYVLLAGFFDHSLMRNAFAFEVSRRTSLAPVTPQGRFVHLAVNGKYQGVYYLCEAAKNLVTNWLLELDVYAAEEDEYAFYTETNRLPVSVKRPDKPSPSCLEEIRGIVNRVDANPDSSCVDFDTFADYWILQELCMNAEPNGPRSCYVSIPSGGKRIQAGPVWDFDLAFNSVGVDAGGNLRPTRFIGSRKARWLTVDSLYNPYALWYGSLLADAAFRTHVQQRWQELRPEFGQLVSCIDSLDALIAPVATVDQRMWNRVEPARFDTCTTYASAVNHLRMTYIRRLAVLDSLIHTLP